MLSRAIVFLLTALIAVSHLTAAPLIEMKSGEALLRMRADDGIGYTVELSSGGSSYCIPKPICLDLDGVRLEGVYASVVRSAGEVLLCDGSLRSNRGTRFHFQDRYRVVQDGAFELARVVQVSHSQMEDRGFNSAFCIELGMESPFLENEYFVPGIWYRTNFMSRVAGELASDSNDHDFIFREDRLPLPLVAARCTRSGSSLALIHAASTPTSFAGDHGLARVIDERMQFGSLGVRRSNRTSLCFLYPGSEGEKNRIPGESPNGWALRSHPVREGVMHRYKLILTTATLPSYAALVEKSWLRAFQLYQPILRRVDLRAAYRGLIETLDHYAVSERDGYDAPGFPFSVYLPDGKVREYNYQMGFIGRQIPNAYYLIHAGIEFQQKDWMEKGTAILDFWAKESLLPDGLPRTWYEPAREGQGRGHWRASDNRHGGVALRVAATGMQGLLEAWRKMRHVGREKQEWLAACRKFGDWLVSNQNDDGSYYLAYDQNVANGCHAPIESSKTTTSNSIRFLIELHRATNDERYRLAALRAGEYCLRNTHESYCYAGSVIDNPVTIDRESGQEALSAFLALHDATRDQRWLGAAMQAARYTETWMYAYEVPALDDDPLGFPPQRSIVGQTLIASGHSAADLGMAFSSYDYYRLYLFTGDVHFLSLARLLFHNTKQALNWDGSLYPGLARGLQLEAFTVSLPRRRGVLECLSWNYAAHLDPLVRLKERFGNIDLDVIEQLPLPQRQALNALGSDPISTN